MKIRFKFCTMCGERCTDPWPGQLVADTDFDLHVARHFKRSQDPPALQPLAVLPPIEAFQRAFGREPTAAELERILLDADAVYGELAAGLS